MSRDTTTWRKQFDSEREDSGDETEVVAVAPADVDLDREFYPGYGTSEGHPILIWTKRRVYFPVVYDGAEWMGSAPRMPVATGQDHVGGQ